MGRHSCGHEGQCSQPHARAVAAACSGCHQKLNGRTAYKPSVGVCEKCSDGSGDARWTTSCAPIAQALGVMWTSSLDPTGVV